jgi:hypothetical protein
MHQVETQVDRQIGVPTDRVRPNRPVAPVAPAAVPTGAHRG